MKGNLLSKCKFNKKTVGVVIIMLTVLYLVIGTVFAQEQTKNAEIGVTYNKDHLSYGDIWAFDSDAHKESNYSKSNTGAYYKYYTEGGTSNAFSGNIAQTFYSDVTIEANKAPTGTPMPLKAFTLFRSNTMQSSVPSPVNGPDIPVVEATASNALYSVVPDSTGTYYVYAYSENGTPTTMYYSMIDSPEADIAHTAAANVTTQLSFESVGNNWYRAQIEVGTVKWHAVYVNNELKNNSSNTRDSGTGSFSGGQDNDSMILGPIETYYYNAWSDNNVYYNTVIVFRFDTTVKLGPVTKTGDTVKITNASPDRGDITACNVFGEAIEIGKAVTMPHSPVIVSGEAKGNFMMDSVNIVKGKGSLSAIGNDYVYSFEEPSELSVSWAKLVNLPSILVTGGDSDLNMNFFGAKTAEFIHPAGTDRTYTFTANFDGASDLGSLSYSYTFNGAQAGSGTLTPSDSSFSFSDVCYKSVEVTFTATDKDGDSYTAVCTINLSDADSTAPFQVNGNYYHTWEEAINAASSGSNKTVILNSDYTLPSDLHENGLLQNGTYVTESGGRINYRLPDGVTFVAPYKEGANTVNAGNNDHPYANEQQVSGNGGNPVAVTKYVYLTLTVSSGASVNLENNSTLAVGGSTNGSCTIAGSATATHSNIYLEENAEINVKSGARLSACGYIYGKGTVTAENGSTVYMPFSVIDFRGGGYTVAVAGRLDSSYGLKSHPSGETALSPFIRYVMNAIQTKLIVNPGATVQAYLNLAASGENHNTNATVIGAGTGLIQTSGAMLEITYDSDTYASPYSSVGKTKIKINGDATFGSLVLNINVSIASATINTSKVNFPLPYNYDIEIASGTFTVPYNIMLLPGSCVTVDEGATANVTASLTVYDGLHDYTSTGSESLSQAALKGWESGSGSNPESTYTDTVAPSSLYPSTAALQGATFGGSGSADLIVNGTLNLNGGSKIGGIIQTGSSANARVTTASGIGTNTKTQVGAVGAYSFLTKNYAYAGATVRTLTGEVLDAGTGKRTAITAGKTYYPCGGAGNINSYEYTLYYDNKPSSTVITEGVSCILQGSWYNYNVNVHTVKDGTILETNIMHFAHGADASQYYTDKACTQRAGTVTGEADLYFNAAEAEAKIVWANGGNESYYMSVRNAVQAATHAGDRIVQLKDLDNFTSVIGPAEGQDFIFDMNGKTINYCSTPFTSVGGKMTVDVNGGRITNVVNGKPYDSPVISLNDPNNSLVFLLNGGTVSITGNADNPIKNGGVENAGNLTVDLGGGTWEYRTGLSIKTMTDPEKPAVTHNLTPLTAYRSKAMFNNAGTLTIKDSKSGGTIVTDLIQDYNSFASTYASQSTTYTSVIRNNANGSLILGGGNIRMDIPSDENGNPITNNGSTPVPIALYSAAILNFGEIRSCDEGTALSIQGSGSYALYNFVGATADLDLRGGTISHTPYKEGVAIYAAMYNGKSAIVNNGVMTLRNSNITVPEPTARSYGIFNSGGEIGLIENCQINAPYGIYNQNVIGNSYATAGGSTIRFHGHIGTVKDTDITVAQYAILNRGVIDEIIGDSTFTAANPSAQVPWENSTIANSNNYSYTVYNSNTWWGTTPVWRRTDVKADGSLTRTDEYKWEDEYRPTIGKISGDVKIIAENTSTSVSHGMALFNAGVIGEISGNVDIKTYVHPDNTTITHSRYAFQNTAGGKIDRIIGNVKISAGIYALQNSTGSPYVKTVTTYLGETATGGKETHIERSFYHDNIGIGEITGDRNGTGIVIETTNGSYALENHARIGNITGKVSITADNGSYALQNTTSTGANVYYTYSWPGQSPDAQKTYHEEYLMASIGTIGGNDSEILIRSKRNGSAYTLHNNGQIEAIIGATVEDTVGYNNVPTVINDTSYTVKDTVYTNIGYNEIKSWYDTSVTRNYVYKKAVIGKLDGVTVTTPMNYALRNSGEIGSITNSSFTAVKGYGIDNRWSYDVPPQGETYSRSTIHYYHGKDSTSLPFSTAAQYFGETNIRYNSKQATIGSIDNVTITVENGSFGIQNAGIIDSISNSNITVSGSYAIGNTARAATGEDVSGMENYIYKKDDGNYAVTAAAAITDKVWTYESPTINSIGEGNTIQAAARAIENKGYIGEIGGESTERTTIKATSQTGSNQQAIFNSDGLVTRAVRENSTTTVNALYANATIGTIKNVSVSNGITYAIQNGAGSTYYCPVIKEIGEGAEVYSAKATAVYNATNAKIEKISGGIFTTGVAGNFYALQNNSTVNPIALSGGYFKSGTGDRAHAVYQPDDATRYTYPQGVFLSAKGKNITFADGTADSGYYFVTENKFSVIFDGNGAPNGIMDKLEISLANPELTVTLPNNAFSWTDWSFRGWSKDQYANEETLSNGWAGSLSELQALLGGDIQPGEEVILFAVWTPNKTVISGDFEYAVLSETDKTCIITKYNGTASDLKIPSQFDGYTVNCIKTSAFSGCNSLENVKIPSSVKSIGKSAFEGCASLSGIVIPESVTNIGDSAFSGCTSLTIYGYLDSYAQTYAAENSITFVAIGDLNDDGIIDSDDYAILISYVMCELKLTEKQLIIGDYNIDGAVDGFDAIELDMYIHSQL